MRVNGEPACAATRVRVGDTIHLKRLQLEHELTVTGIPLRRGPAREAKACFEESAESVARRQQRVSDLKVDRLQMPMTRGKPDKHTRRKLRNRNRRSG